MSDQEELERLADQFFASARGERPPTGAKDSVLAAVLEASKRPREASTPKRAEAKSVWLWPGIAAAIALLVGVALMVSSSFFRSEPATVTPERVPDEPNRRVLKPTVPETPAIPAPAVPTASSSGNRLVPEKRATPQPLTLSEEVAALDQIRATLQARDAAGALEALNDYERRPGIRLRDEATLLRLEALAATGRAAEAAEIAARFVESNPGSTLADKARTYLKLEAPEGDRP